MKTPQQKTISVKEWLNELLKVGTIHRWEQGLFVVFPPDIFVKELCRRIRKLKLPKIKGKVFKNGLVLEDKKKLII